MADKIFMDIPETINYLFENIFSKWFFKPPSFTNIVQQYL